MPFIEVTLVQGRTPQQLRSLITGLTDAAETALAVSRPTIRVVLREVPDTHWAAGDVTIAERNQRS